MDPIVDRFARHVRRAELNAPRRPMISSLSGEELRAEEAMDPSYWVRHLRHTARLDEGFGRLLQASEHIFLEVGPGHGLSTRMRHHPARRKDQSAIASLPLADADEPALPALLEAFGRLWLAGADPDPEALFNGEGRRRVAVPGYPFNRQRYWLEPCADEPHPDASRPAVRHLAAEHPRPELETPYVAPTSEFEQALARIWQDLLGIQDIGVDDDFFELGGHSLKAAQLISRVREEFDVELPLKASFESPTIAGLAENLETLRWVDRGTVDRSTVATDDEREEFDL